MKDSLTGKLKKQSYFLVGEHSGVKLCHWMKQSLTAERMCYKQQFYGIKSHRCLQMTPTVNQCNQDCQFCWRYQGETERGFPIVDDPVEILDGCIAGQRTLLTGYKGNDKTNMEMWEEAQEPNQVAISLTGEPTMYPRLGEFIEECHKRNMTTFLVTNGTLPEVIEKLDPLPTQIYVSVDAPNEEIYKKLCRPSIKNGWEKLNETLELFASLDTRTVIRHTLVQEHNLGYVKEYAALDRKADPLLVEPKGFVFVGYARQRMNLSNMPSHDTVLEFSKELAVELDMKVLDEKPSSRVTVLGKDEKDLKIPGL